MLRFVDLKEAYWSDEEDKTPICAFLFTATDRFVKNYESGGHVFDCLEDIKDNTYSERMLRLMPENYFGEPEKNGS